MFRALDCCMEHRWLEANAMAIVGKLTHCLPSSKWIRGGSTGELKVAGKATVDPSVLRKGR